MNKEDILNAYRLKFYEGFANNQPSYYIKENSLPQRFDLISASLVFASYLSSIP